ncbi:MAG: TonB-dependent receptor [Saprospiraceae bacterium]|nr:TonB-dependent receptor [Saprospiraceae bacterium]
MPGPLTDSMFYADPTQSTRSRNYFNPIINVPSITLKWKISPKSKMQFVSSALIGTRNSILFDKPATIQDSINRITLQYENRQVDVDRFNSYTQELRYLQQFNIGNFTNHIAGGLQLMTNDLHRTQLGKGSRNSDFDLNLVDPIWGRDLHFKTQNIAAFVENNFEVTKNFSINVGARFETGESKLKRNYCLLSRQ